MKLKEVLDLYPALHALCQVKLTNTTVAYRLGKNLRLTNQAIKVYEEERARIAAELGKLAEQKEQG